MKRFLAAAAVFLGSLALFLALPSPVLIQVRDMMTNSLGPFTADLWPIMNRTAERSGPATDGLRDRIESRVSDRLSSPERSLRRTGRPVGSRAEGPELPGGSVGHRACTRRRHDRNRLGPSPPLGHRCAGEQADLPRRESPLALRPTGGPGAGRPHRRPLGDVRRAGSGRAHHRRMQARRAGRQRLAGPRGVGAGVPPVHTSVRGGGVGGEGGAAGTVARRIHPPWTGDRVNA